MVLLGKVKRGECEVGHALERDQIAFFKGIRVIGEKLEQTTHLAASAQQRQDNDGRYAECAASLEVNARIGFRVIAAQQLPARDAFPGESGTNLQAGADRRRAGTGAGAAHHLVPLRQGESSSSCTRNVLGALDEKLKRSFEFGLLEFPVPVELAISDHVNPGRIVSDQGGLSCTGAFGVSTKRCRSVVGLGGLRHGLRIYVFLAFEWVDGSTSSTRTMLTRVSLWMVWLSRAGRKEFGQ